MTRAREQQSTFPKSQAIAAIDIYLLPADANDDGWCIRKPWLFISIRNVNGQTGWGEAFTFSKRTSALVGMLKNLSSYICGLDSLDRCGIMANVLQNFAEQQGGPELYAALSAIDQALWDLAGKSMRVSVASMLGVAPNSEISCYANIWSDRPKTAAQLVDKAARMSEQGYPAIKLYPMYYEADERAAVSLIRAVRDSIDPSCEIILDFWRMLRPDQVIRILRASADSLLWVEDPLRMTNLSTVANLNRKIDFSVVLGETECGLRSFRPLMEQGAVGAISPDVALCGGITEMRKIADLAETYDISLMPHCYGGPISMIATWHAVAGYRNFKYMETFPELFSHGDEYVLNLASPTKGLLRISEEQGLGLVVDEKKITAYRIP